MLCMHLNLRMYDQTNHLGTSTPDVKSPLCPEDGSSLGNCLHSCSVDSNCFVLRDPQDVSNCHRAPAERSNY